jgi:hypothetical protein
MTWRRTGNPATAINLGEGAYFFRGIQPGVDLACKGSEEYVFKHVVWGKLKHHSES